MGRFVPISLNTVGLEKRAPKVSAAGSVAGAKSYYDGTQCWQYKVVYDRPGCYCFVVPTTALCARTVIVGGGGKPMCTNGNCCGFAGAGGAYSEKFHSVTGGTTYFTICVGRQQQNSSVACNGSAVHTAGGASYCTPGTASGGDFNSSGGLAGYNCNYCGGSVSHYCGACIYTNTTTCCGYCLVFSYTDAQHGDTNGCCLAAYAGGGSAGSPRACQGGCGMTVCNSGTINHGATAGGGGGMADLLTETHLLMYGNLLAVTVFAQTLTETSAVIVSIGVSIIPQAQVAVVEVTVPKHLTVVVGKVFAKRLGG